jgi:GxxExxY protein
VIGCAIEVHKQMGPGLTEPIYRDCLCLELSTQGIDFHCQWPIKISYKGQRLRRTFFIDLLVESRLVIELKAVDGLHPVHQAQAIAYLRLTGHPAALVINFNETKLLNGLKRLDHPDRYARKQGRIGTNRKGLP